MLQVRPDAAEAPVQGFDGGPTFTVQDETSLLRQVLRQVTSAGRDVTGCHSTEFNNTYNAH